MFNNAGTLGDTIASVASQDYADIEYIIIDGGSTDGTVDIIKKHEINITKWISEKDNGIYDAMNKGLRMATGDVIGILNADDLYQDSTVVSSVMKSFIDANAGAVYGDLVYINKENTKIIRYWQSGPFYKNNFLWGWMPPHPSFFVKKKFYDIHGFFNTSLRSAADYELMLRLIHKHKVVLAYLPKILVKMRVGGQSNASIANRIKAIKEDIAAWRINELKPYFFTIVLKSLRKVSQFFLKPGV